MAHLELLWWLYFLLPTLILPVIYWSVLVAGELLLNDPYFVTLRDEL